MKIVVEMDDGNTINYQNVTDVFIAVRVDDPHGSFTKSNSWGSNPRELVKEVTQSVLELQNYLREHAHGNSGSG